LETVAVIELVMSFTDSLSDDPSGTSEFSYTLNAPFGFEVTGGQLFVENPSTSELERFSFRIDRDTEGTPSLTILENPRQ
jgi:hypothetical protein